MTKAKRAGVWAPAEPTIEAIGEALTSHNMETYLATHPGKVPVCP